MPLDKVPTIIAMTVHLNCCNPLPEMEPINTAIIIFYLFYFYSTLFLFYL